MPLAPGGVNANGEIDNQVQGQAWLRMAQSAASSGDYQTAVGMFTQIANRDPKNDSAWYGLGDLLLQLGQPQGAADSFAQIMKRRPGDARATIGYARAMMAIGRPEAAAAHIEPLADSSPDDIKLLNLLGVIRDLQGDHDSAQALYRRGLFVDPESVMLRNNLALSAALGGNYRGAIELMRPLVEGLNSTRQTRQNFALIHGMAGDYAEARRISRIDLDSASTDSNVAFFASLRSMEPSQARSAVLTPKPLDDPAIRPVERTEPVLFPGGLREHAGQMSMAEPKTDMMAAAIADEGTGDEAGDDLATPVVLGVAPTGGAIELAETPNESWFVTLGRFENSDAAAQRWAELRASNAALLANLRPLAASESEGSHALTVGPLSGKAEAGLICRRLADSYPDCQALQL